MKKLLLKIFILIFCIALCSSCSCSKNNNLVIYRNYYDQDVTTFNYIITNKYQDIMRIANLVDGLVENDKYGNIVPSIAKSWKSEIINEKQVWTFYLKNDVYWSDYRGNKYSLVTANDFVTTLKYSLNYNTQSANYSLAANLLENGLNYYNATLIKNFDYENIIAKISQLQINDPNSELSYYKEIKDIFDSCSISNMCIDNFDLVGIKAINDFELQFTLTNPVPYFLSSLTYYAFLPANENFIKEIGFNNFGTSKKTLLYNGAYLLSDYAHSSRIEYSKNPNYWDIDNVFIDKLVFTKSLNYHSPNFTRLAYENGNIDEFVVNESDETGWNKYVLNNNGSEDNPGGDNTYVSEEVSNYTTYYVAYNQNRTNYNFTTLTDEERQLANKAMNNLNFRKALTHGLNRSYYFNNEINSLVSTIVPKGFSFHNDKDYYDYFVENYSNRTNSTYTESLELFNSDPYYDIEKSLYYLNLAIDEMNISDDELPIKIEYTYYYDENYKILEKDRIDKWNKELNGCSITDDNCNYDKVMVVYNDTVNSVSNFYNAILNQEYHLTFIGLYPDFNDPTTFLSAFGSNGELSSYTNHNENAQIDILLDEINSYYKDSDLDKRYELCASLEYYIILEKNLVLPLSLKGSNKQIIVSNFVPFSKMKASYGLSPFKFKYRKIRTVNYTQADISKLKEEYEEGKK